MRTAGMSLKFINDNSAQFIRLGRGVTGNTPDFGSGESRFETWRPSQFVFISLIGGLKR